MRISESNTAAAAAAAVVESAEESGRVSVDLTAADITDDDNDGGNGDGDWLDWAACPTEDQCIF
jgi:hypothetical protein